MAAVLVNECNGLSSTDQTRKSSTKAAEQTVMRIPASLRNAPQQLRRPVATRASFPRSAPTHSALSLTTLTTTARTVPASQRAFASSSSSSTSSAASAPTSRVLLQDAARRGKRRLRDASSGSSQTLLAALGLEHNQSNAYYNQHLRAALDRKDLNTAMQILTALRSPDRYVDAIAAARTPVIWTQNYDLLLFEWSKRGDVKQVLTLLDEMVAFNRVSQRSFNTALVACSRRRRLQSAARVLQLMRDSGKTPGSFAYANVINCCSKGDGNVKMADKFWNEMLREGVEPSTEVLNCMLRVYNRPPGRSLEALAFVRQAIDLYDLTLDDISISQLVMRLLQDGNLDETVAFVEEVQEQMTVEIDVLNAVLDASRQLECWEHVARVERIILSQDRVGASENTVTQRLLALSEAEDASSPGIAWTLTAPHPPISARTKQKEAVKQEVRSAKNLKRMLREIIAALESGDGENEQVLGQVSNLKQWERMFTASPIGDIERFIALCEQLDASAELDGARREVFLDVGMYNLYLLALGKHAGKAATALDVLDQMIEKEMVDRTSFNNVLAMCSRKGNLKCAEEVLSKMKIAGSASPDCMPSTFSYNAVLNCCAVRKDIPRAEHCFDELQTAGLSPDLVTVNTMLKAYASASVTSLSRHNQTRTPGDGEPGITYAERALKLVQRSARKNRIEPDAATYFSLFRTFVQEADKIAASEDEDDDGCHEQVSACIKRTCLESPVQKLDAAVFNAGIDYFQRFGDVKTSFELFNAMKERGLQPNDLTLCLLFAACSRSEQVEVGLKFLHFLMDEHAYHPSLEVLNGAIRLCASSDSPDNALELFNGMQSSGALRPNEATYVHLIHAFARQGDIAEAQNVTDMMKERLGFTSVDAYNRVLQACAVAHAPTQALDVLQQMKDREALRPNAVSYDLVLKAFAKGKRRVELDDDDDDETQSEVLEGEEEDLDDDAADMRYLDDDFESSGDVRQLMTELLDEMKSSGLPLSAITYKRVIAACAARGDTDGVLMFFDAIMLHRSTSSDATMKLLSESSVENYLKACSRVKDLDRVTELMQFFKEWHYSTGASVSPRVMLHLLNALDVLGEWRNAVAVLRDLERTYGVRPNVTFFNRVLGTCNTASQYQYVDQIFVTMQNAAAYRIYPNAQSYIEAIYAAEQREEWVHATNLFMEMQKKCPKDEVSSAQLQKIALGRYSEGRRKL